MYVLGFSIVDIRRGYDEVFNIKFYYNMLGLYIEFFDCWVFGESCRCRMCVYIVYICIGLYGISIV